MSLRTRSVVCALLLSAGLGCVEEGVNEPRVPASLTLDAASVTLDDGAARQLVATVRDAEGDVVFPLPDGLSISWSSSDPARVTVSDAGLVTALLPGTATVTATVATLEASAGITVLPVPTELQRSAGNNQNGLVGAVLPVPLRVRVLDRHSGAVPGATVTFAVTSGGGAVAPATVSTNGAGEATATWTLGGTVGQQQVTASAPGLAPLVFVASATTAGNAAPVATIVRPLAGATYRAGDRITFTGSGADAEDGVLALSRLTWLVDFHHDTHTHPFLGLTSGIDSGDVVIPRRGETDDDVWYRFYLTVTDLQGASHTVHREISPEKATLQFQTVPAGLSLTLDGAPRTAPFSVLGVVGLERDLGVVSPQTVNGVTYHFVSWSQGGAASQVIVTPPTPTTYTATFEVGQAQNLPPTVSLTAPAAGANITVNTAATVSAAAADADGTVAQVQFFANGTSIGTDATAPYSVPWTPTATGLHRLTARATDDDGAITASDTVNVNVVPAGTGDVTAPTAQLTAPSNGALDLTGAITLSATASDNVGVAGVQFQVDGEDVGAEDTAAPYSVVLPSTAAYASGVHVVRARARDAAGNLSAWSTASVTFGGTQALPTGFTMSAFGGALTGIGTAMAFAPDGRLFVTQQNGRIRIVRDGALLAQDFAQLSVNADGERGLLGIALHPNFASNGFVYVHYLTSTNNFQTTFARIARFTANGDVAQVGGPQVLVDFPTDQNIFHNGGAIKFGADGRLYVAIGDDVTAANSQLMTNTFGKMLRFNDDGTIPTDNPFFGSTSGLNRSIWALGLRNPYTFAIQPGTGRMFINDVGGYQFEEINEGFAGANYGWPTSEGPTTNPNFVGPLYWYECFQGLVRGCAIVGAAFYDPPSPSFPASYTGNYLFGDYVSRWIHRMDPANGNAVYRFASLPGGVTSLEVGPDGAVYVIVAPSFTSSQIYRISRTP